MLLKFEHCSFSFKSNKIQKSLDVLIIGKMLVFMGYKIPNREYKYNWFILPTSFI